MSKSMARLVLCMVALTTAALAATPQTFLTLNSQPGDYVGQGQQYSFNASQGTFLIGTVPNLGEVVMTFHSPDWSQTWQMGFAPPAGHKLNKGMYEGAQSVAVGSPTAPGISASGDGRGCNSTAGRFYVSDIFIDSTGTVQRFAVDFEQHCEGAPPALYGSFRYQSTATAIPRVSIGATAVLKGNAGTSDGNAIVSLSMPSTQTVTVQFNTIDAGALQGQDYVSTAGTVQFQPGVTSQTITIPILGNLLARGNKIFNVKLSLPTGAPLGAAMANVKILDPNVAMSALAVSSQPGDFVGGGANYLYTIGNTSFSPRVNYDNGVDVYMPGPAYWLLSYAAADQATLTAGSYPNAQRFPFQAPGFPGLSISGNARGCNTLSGSFVVNKVVFNAGLVKQFSADAVQNCEGAAPALFAWMRINMPLQQVSVTNAVVDSGSSTVTFTVTLHPAAKTAVSVNFATVDGTAVAGVDYLSTSQSVNFAAGTTAQTVTVPLLRSPGAGTTFYGQLSTPSGAPIWIGQGSATF